MRRARSRRWERLRRVSQPNKPENLVTGRTDPLQLGVNPSAETVATVDTYRSLKVSRQNTISHGQWSPVEEAETSSAGGQLVEEYSAETHSGDGPGLRKRSPA
jgi:hypothetical protein